MHDMIGRRGNSDIMPAGVDLVDDCIEACVAGVGIAKQDVRRPGSQKIADARELRRAPAGMTLAHPRQPILLLVPATSTAMQRRTSFIATIPTATPAFMRSSTALAKVLGMVAIAAFGDKSGK